MRWIMNHMIIETSRRAGHADISRPDARPTSLPREQIDGRNSR
jgi:hypothetical protein